MATTEDFLVEIGTEELPPKALRQLSEAFTTQLGTLVADAKLEHGAVAGYASPRRLAVRISALAVEQPDQIVERRGPSLAAAFDAAGKPTGAALGFARSCGVDLEALGRLETDKGACLAFTSTVKGQPTAQLMPALVDRALAALPIPKRMRWGARSEEFVRPVHWVVMLHGASVVPAEILGIATGNATRGHRFLSPGPIVLAHAREYLDRLEKEGSVIADFAARRDRVRALVEAAAIEAGGRAIIDPALLDEVTALVEWPAPICGSFEPHFLELPREALIASMQGHQKYFPLEDANGQLINRFITVANLVSPKPELVRDGNERVIRPRLSDAAFFYRKDRQTSLAGRVPKLGDIVFERRLGTVLEKSERVAKLAAEIAADFGADAAHAARAALLSRCDLLSEMVGEFPELQGTMGGYYARHDGEHADVAQAIGEFYQPRFAGDAIPASAAGRCVAVAEKLDTLVGIFAVGGAPTGDKDPYALRRAALGCLRICIESGATVDLAAALGSAKAGYGERFAAEDVDTRVLDFVLDRTRGYYADAGVRGDLLESVLATRPTSPADLARRVAAVQAFVKLPQAAALAAANKRISNILKKTPERGAGRRQELLQEGAEVALAAEVDALSAATRDLLARGDYANYLLCLAALHDPVNAFFDGVLVMADEPAVRHNRLALLAEIQNMFLRVADIAYIA
ncbi:MAG: glycine--tRNA ligase subunit beta [Gammaproteobacteria bacterium]|nr:glycine--tRNA ligase subunit beta [Gammaproteobacteria bacterium]MBI5618984.1 glycine--tRNA ligase subunit beta [Gammaproteobacteria bacterium]